MTGNDLEPATEALRAGKLVVYPTETVYGLGGDALDPATVKRVFAVKGRDRDEPISMAVPGVDAAARYTNPTDPERQFMRTFLPGPVTVVVEAAETVPDVLTGGRERVGVRVPDHDLALSLLERVAPITATSANVSGNPAARRLEDVDDRVREAATIHLDGGYTAGGGSTVVDVTSGEIHRRGRLADEVEAWLADH